jgi:hypothetical protein
MTTSATPPTARADREREPVGDTRQQAVAGFGAPRSVTHRSDRQNLSAGYDTVCHFVSLKVRGGQGQIARNAGDIGVFVDALYYYSCS